MLKRLAKQLFRCVGYELITLATADEFLLEGNLRQLFRTFGIRQVFDVGANEGQYRETMRVNLPFFGRIVSWEPNPHLASKLRQRAKRDGNWLVREAGLGARPCSMEFNIAKSSQVSSFLAFAENTRHVQVEKRITVSVESLNDVGEVLFREIPPERTFVKLDTQGFDLEVMKGASRFLPRIPFLTTEVPFVHIYEDMPGFRDVFGYMESLQFDLAGMWPTSRDQLFRAREFDCLFINRNLAEKAASKKA